MKMVKGLESTLCKEHLRCLAVLNPEQLRGGLMAATAPHRERRAVLSSAPCDSDRA